MLKKLFRKKTKVVLDTNALLLFDKGVDLFTLIAQAMQEPYELCTHGNVYQELERLMQGRKKESFAAKLGYIMAKQKALKTLSRSSDEHVDDVIVKKADNNTVVVTQDRELIARLTSKGVRVLRYQQHKLVFQH